MFEKGISVVMGGIMTRHELLSKGYEEIVTKFGRIGYRNGLEVVAVECARCKVLKRFDEFHKSKADFCGVRTDCKACRTKYNRSSNSCTRERGAIYRENNKELLRDKQRIYRDNNKDATALYGRKYREDNKERERERHLVYQINNPRKMRELRNRRRARMMSLPSDMTSKMYVEVYRVFDGACSLSDEEADLHDDHILPLSIGHGGTVFGNMIPLASYLNNSKYNSHIFEWFDVNHVRFGLSQDKFNALIEYLASANDMTTHEYRVYTDWCFDNPRIIDDVSGELVFRDGAINDR